MIYLDNAATTFPKSEEVYNRINKALRSQGVNAGRGGYKLARQATDLMDETRKKLLQLLDILPIRNVVFTPSATIALNQIISGLEWSSLKNVYVTPFEHNAIMRPLQNICDKYGVKINTIPFHKDTWKVNVEELEHLFAINKPDYIFMSHMSNVTGYILPCEKIIETSKKYDPQIIVDCAQSLGSIPIHPQIVEESDYIVFAGHKSLYGPMGVGGFITKDTTKLEPYIFGGTGSDSLNLYMPESGVDRYEAGSHNIIAIAGLSEAINWIHAKKKEIYEHKKELTTYLIGKLEEIDEVEIYLPENLEHHVGVISFNIEGWQSEEVGKVLDEDFDIAVRTGYHCAPFVHDFIETKDKLGTVRASLGYFNTKSDVDKLINAICELIEG